MAEFADIFESIKNQSNNMIPGFDKIHAYMKVRTDLMFEREGGRGVTWAPFSENYKVRPSGAVVDKSSKLLHDIGRLQASAAKTITTKSNKKFAFGTRLQYAGFQQAMRPFLFWEAGKDEIEAGKFILDHLIMLIPRLIKMVIP